MHRYMKSSAADCTNTAVAALACNTQPGVPPVRLPSGAFLLLLSFLVFCVLPGSSFANPLLTEQGRASWYGTTAHGKPTANGEIFNRYNLTAAHKNLPFGTVIRVHNLKNGRYILVRVNDRGPYSKGRMLDISRRAADALKMLHTGVAAISYEVVSDSKGVPLNGDNAFFVVIRNEKNALKARLQSDKLSGQLGKEVKVLPTLQSKKKGYALCIGPFDTFGQAQKEFLRCEEENIALNGIVEAPASGEIIPRYIAPDKTKVQTATAKTPDSGAPAAAKTLPWGSALQTIWGRSLEKSAHFLDLTLGAVSGIQNNQPIFRLHYSLLSGYLDISS